MNFLHLTLYLCAINLLTYGTTWFDKRMAARGGWRVPEANLLGLAMLGGSPGLWIAMKHFRHKTAKKSFYLRVIVLIVMQALALIYALNSGLIEQAQ